MTSFTSIQELLGAAGTLTGTTEWTTLSQERINGFAEATGDNQWIHVDVEKAKAGPFGNTIAHGYLTLSLCAPFLGELVHVGGISMGINYGIDKARFIAPVPAGSRVRASGEIVSVTEVPGGAQAVIRLTIELEGSAKPAAVVDTVSRFLA
ncbi:MAG: MaoC family dehydratase [Acidimicrobiia bacterium]|nr:MaoC family dehydratase [Acidimicrobiia bacterium]